MSKSAKQSEKILKPKVGILCPPGGQSLIYQNFLVKKDYEIFLYNKVEQCISGALTDQLRYLFVDVEFPDQRVNKLIIALAKSMPIYTIPFANSNHSKLRRIQPHLKTPYCIFPPTTPSAIHRMIVRIQVNEEKARSSGNIDISLMNSVLPSIDYTVISGDKQSQLKDNLLKILQTSEGNDGDSVIMSNGAGPEAVSSQQKTVPTQKGDLLNAEVDKKLLDISGQLEKSPNGKDLKLLAKGAIEAVYFTFGNDTGKKEGKQALGRVTDLKCFVVNSQKFKGYLLYASAGPQKAQDVLAKILEEKINQFMSENEGSFITEQEQLELKIVEVELEPWAKAKAEFLVKSSDADGEVALAFISRTDVAIPEVSKKNGSQKMLALKTKEIPLDNELEFDIFLFMPINDKFVKYQKKGQMFKLEQKNKLESKGINEVFASGSDRSAVQKRRAQAYVNEKILEFYNLVKKAA